MPSTFEAAIYQALWPWLESLSTQAPPSREYLNAFFSRGNAGSKPIRLVPSDARPSKHYLGQYEVRCHLHGEIAYRDDSWHDAFNALAWLAFPTTKAAITQGHFDALEVRRREEGQTADPLFIPAGPRGARRDALTLFDEGGLIAASADGELLELIRHRQWKRLFWGRREAVAQRMRFFVLGHALYEKALNPYKGMTARALLLETGDAFLGLPPQAQREFVDKAAARRVMDAIGFSASSDVPPLPLMGIPGWCENGFESFYDDVRVFRPIRQAAL